MSFVFGTQNISTTFSASEYRAVASAKTCQDVATISFKGEIHCTSYEFETLDTYFNAQDQFEDLIYLVVPIQETEAILTQLNADEALGVSNIISNTTFKTVHDAAFFKQEVNASDEVYLDYHAQSIIGAEFVIGYVYPYLFFVFLMIITCFTIISYALFEAQIRIYSVHILTGLPPYKAKIAAIIHYASIALLSMFFLKILQLPIHNDYYFYALFYGTYFIIMLTFILLNITNKKLLSNLRKDRYL